MCMRLAEMELVHPLMNREHCCERCGEILGLYPTGQAILAKYGRERIELVCNRCLRPDIAILPETAFAEMEQSIPNPVKKGGRN